MKVGCTILGFLMLASLGADLVLVRYPDLGQSHTLHLVLAGLALAPLLLVPLALVQFGKMKGGIGDLSKHRVRPILDDDQVFVIDRDGYVVTDDGMRWRPVGGFMPGQLRALLSHPGYREEGADEFAGGVGVVGVPFGVGGRAGGRMFIRSVDRANNVVPDPVFEE